MAKRPTIFAARDSSNGTELWVTDGTPEGTVLLSNIAPGSLSSNPGSFTALGNGLVVFTANDGVYGTELWVTNGTTKHTHLLKDIYPGKSSSSITGFTALGDGRVVFTAEVFTADDATHHYELWVTDGTKPGTRLLKDNFLSTPGSFVALGNGQVVFMGNDVAHSYEPWVTNGTQQGTHLLKDIIIGSSTSEPRYFTALGNGLMVFTARDDTLDYKLWVTDGTETSLLMDTHPGSPTSYLTGFTTLGDGRAVFAGYDDTHGYEPWVTDGTPDGTFLLNDIYPLDNSSNSGNFIALGNGEAIFTANDLVHGAELWVTDGTKPGTHLLKDINPETISSSVTSLTALGDGLAVFQANDGVHGAELWVTDGTKPGTHLLKDIWQGSSPLGPFGSAPHSFAALGNGRAVFQANDGIHGDQFWGTDGTEAGTSVLMDLDRIGPQLENSISGLTALGDGRALFNVHRAGATGLELWVTDGTAAGTYHVTDFSGLTPQPTGFTAVVPPVIGTAGGDSLSGGSADDVISGLAGNDTLSGGAGDDWLDGGTGNDVMKGGVGNDTYVVGSAGDVVTELTGQGTDTVQSSISYTLAANVERLTLTGSTNIIGTGNNLANLLTGNTGNNTLDGKAGADTMKGGAGYDTYIVDNAGDVVTELSGQGTDTVRSSISYALTANVENLTLTGSANIKGTGNNLANLLTGNTGNNTLDGKAGADTMNGGAGNDTYYVDNAGDQVGEGNGPGTDTIYSSVDFSLPGHVENLTLTGSALEATGNGLANVLTGNSRNNVLDGNVGADVMTGGGGSDAFVFSTSLVAGNIDTIADFNVAADTIRLSHTIFNTIVGTGKLSAAQFVANASGTAQDASDRIVYETDTGKLFYDSNGSAAGGSVQFATVLPRPALTNADFSII